MYYDGGIVFACCPDPRLGLEPNHDILYSSVSLNSLSSSLDIWSKVATAFVNFTACVEIKIVWNYFNIR